MITKTMEIRFIAFVGPHKKSARLDFDSGLNLVFGPSNTGKSSVLDAIEFMLGRERELKEIPEHEGYDQVLLGIEFSDKEKFTLFRSISGKGYECFHGFHDQKPDDQKAQILKQKKPTKNEITLSTFILEKLGLADKKLKKNAKNVTVNLTLRNFSPLSIVSESDIQKEGSPYIGEQHTEKTQHKSRLKLLLTGVDDSSLLPEEAEKRKLSRTAKIEMLNELILEQEETISNTLSEDQTPDELEFQFTKIETTINNEISLLESSEAQYSELLAKRTDFRGQIDKNNNRLTEISEMRHRFTLLEKQYKSDISRLEHIREAGTLVAALPTHKCPLCGHKNITVKDHAKCNDGLGNVSLAATVEKNKLEILQVDLEKVMLQLNEETKSIQDDMPKITDSLLNVTDSISKLNPSLATQRRGYAKLLSTKADVEKSINLHSQLHVLQEKQQELVDQKPDSHEQENDKTDLPTSALHKLSKCVKALFEDWCFPNADNVHFDKEKGDFVVNGKNRISNGKGHRAITHAAATLGLMKYTQENNLPHLGFVILDSPLLAFEKPEKEDDGLGDTDVNLQFLNSLSEWKSSQVIIFENKKSIPTEYLSGKNIICFTKNSNGRYGFFPAG
ncbi:MAG: hypothetical protein KUG81_06490 [Gammaproteobacteria bacterium]|nr:hypothetical protein [Gammaproteobacteria bacterium]